MSAGLVALTASSAGAEDHGQEKVGVCHRTDAESNPYVYIEVPADEANGHITGDAKQHNHKVYWDSAGTWRGVAHVAGQERMDYLAPNGSADCNDTTPPTDVCPNIPGDQATVPAGMVKDTQGNCVTPPPPPTDVCPNIPGDQTSIPAGMVKDTQGNCVTPPPPPTDVCPNIPGDQTSIPAGMVKDTQGNCVTPPPPGPTDVCPNIPDVQTSIPAGMVKDSQGNCVTPPPGPPADVCPNLPGNQAEVPEGYELEDGVCAEILGEETIVPKPKPEPKPDKEPTVKGVQVVAPPAAAPAAAPTAVAAGLGTPPSSALQMIAPMLVAGGMLLLMAGAWIGLGRRETGTHAA